MSRSTFACWNRAALWAVAASFMVLPGIASAQTQQADQRQAGRDVNQAAKQQARAAKIDCRQENNKSNAECRQDKRETKQSGRQAKREIKY